MYPQMLKEWSHVVFNESEVTHKQKSFCVIKMRQHCVIVLKLATLSEAPKAAE